MPNWESLLVQSDDRERQQRKSLTQPFGMMVTSVSSDTEVAKFSYYGNRDRAIELSHPFMSSGAWIRGMPEAGATYVGVFRSDEANPQPTTTYMRNLSKRIDAYTKGQSIYRPIMPGEIDISSSGQGQAFFSRRPMFNLQAGMLTRYADQDALSIVDQAPLHHQRLLQNRSNEIGDETRLGIITRPAPSGSGYSSWDVVYPKVAGGYAAEFLRHIKNPAKASPTVLAITQEGHVLNTAGVQVTQSRTGIPLRYAKRWYANSDAPTSVEVDEKGNYLLDLSTSATEGLEFNVPAGNFKRTIQLDEITTIAGNREDVVQKSANFVIGENLEINTRQNVRIRSELGGSDLIFDSTTGAEKVLLRTKSGHTLILDDTSGVETIYLIHKSGSQYVLDQTGSHKLVSKSGCVVFLDDEQGAVTVTSKTGSMVTVADSITISDKSGTQSITLDGSNTLQIVAKSNVVVNAPKVSVNAGSIDIGNLPILSAVLAEPLAALFDAHIHATPMGPSGPPLPPNTAALINLAPATAFKSSYVKIRGNI